MLLQKVWVASVQLLVDGYGVQDEREVVGVFYTKKDAKKFLKRHYPLDKKRAQWVTKEELERSRLVEQFFIIRMS